MGNGFQRNPAAAVQRKTPTDKNKNGENNHWPLDRMIKTTGVYTKGNECNGRIFLFCFHERTYTYRPGVGGREFARSCECWCVCAHVCLIIIEMQANELNVPCSLSMCTRRDRCTCSALCLLVWCTVIVLNGADEIKCVSILACCVFPPSSQLPRPGCVDFTKFKRSN